jgi:hypothetical protein
MNMNYANPTFQHLSGECRQDSFLQTISPTKRKKALDKNLLKKDIQSNITSSLKKSITRSLDNLSDDIKKASENRNSSNNERVSKQHKAVKFSPAVSTFTRPESNEKNNNAAIEIQRITRGGCQRLHIRIIQLQHKLDTSDELTNVYLERVKEITQQRKDAFRRKLEQKKNKELKKCNQTSSLAEKSKEIIAYLKRENQKLRLKNEKIFKATQALNIETDRLGNCNTASDEHLTSLNDHTKQIEETHAKLNTVFPLYEASYIKTRDAVETRQQFCLSEHTIKLTYVNAIASAMTMMEDGCKDTALVDEIVGYCVDMEGEDNHLPLPPKLELEQVSAENRDESTSSDDEYDAYAVTTVN